MNRENILTPSIFKPLLIVLKAIIDFFYPSYCIVCHCLIHNNERLICDRCWQQLPQIDEQTDLLTEIKSKSIEKIYYSQVISIWEFSPPIQTIIHHLKYQNFKVLANRIGKVMAEKLKGKSLPTDTTILVPVPLHKTRIRERGYNQSALLCDVIALETGLRSNDHILQRIRYTESQTKLNVADRIKNVKNAFRVCDGKEIQNKIVILVDDVITTGATMNACAQELMAHGAEKVYILSAAKA